MVLREITGVTLGPVELGAGEGPTGRLGRVPQGVCVRCVCGVCDGWPSLRPGPQLRELVLLRSTFPDVLPEVSRAKPVAQGVRTQGGTDAKSPTPGVQGAPALCFLPWGQGPCVGRQPGGGAGRRGPERRSLTRPLRITPDAPPSDACVARAALARANRSH